MTAAGAPGRRPVERALAFECDGEPLLGVLAVPAVLQSVGVLVVVGGPQYRVGSHRQFVLLARTLAAAGYPVLRFDHRGMGDSGGEPPGFEMLDADVGAALDAFGAALPALRRFVIWGLCDGASAALLYAGRTRDSRLAGLCLVNPWTRSAETLARTQVKHYYARRVLEPAFWAKLFAGRVGAGALRELATSVRLVLRSRLRSRPDVDPAADGSYTDRMAHGWRRFPGSMLLVLSGDDYTAKEFLEFVAHDAAWHGALANPAVERTDVAGADHTFSTEADRRAVEAATLVWLRGLGADATGPAGRRTGAEAIR